jgi:hypothetical protein
VEPSVHRPSISGAARRGLRCGLIIAALIPGLLAPATARADPVPQIPPTSAAPVLTLGSRGADVHALQEKLTRLSYLPASAVNGVFGVRTWHAVVAFQGWSMIKRDGIVGPQTLAAMTRTSRPVPWSKSRGFEIHIPQQVLLLVSNRRVQRAIHVSTGAGGATPLGHFRVYRRERMSWSVPFHVWMPLAQYFSGGYALHEFAAVPAYPASHGCVRVPDSESRAVWQFGSRGTRLWTTR